MSPTTQTLDSLYATGHWLMSQDRERDALALFRTMLLVDARDERGWLALVACHEKLDEIEKAIALCRIVGSAKCTIARARLHRAAGDRYDATEAYEEALRLAEAMNDDDLVELITTEARAS